MCNVEAKSSSKKKPCHGLGWGFACHLYSFAAEFTILYVLHLTLPAVIPDCMARGDLISLSAPTQQPRSR